MELVTVMGFIGTATLMVAELYAFVRGQHPALMDIELR